MSVTGSAADIAFIGAGKMAGALIGGVISAGVFAANRIVVSDTDPARIAEIGKRYGVSAASGNASAAARAGCVVFAVKPQDMDAALADVSRAGCGEGTVFVSIAAGGKVERIKSFLGKGVPVFRAMPNLPALAGEGACAVCGDGGREGVQTVKKLFGSSGIVEFVDEGLMDAFTALSGSGPGFVAAFAESLAAAGEKLGINPQTAGRFAVQTVFGAALMMKNGTVPRELRKAVTSPGGTTAAGLAAFERNGFSATVENALAAACARAGELSSNGGKKR